VGLLPRNTIAQAGGFIGDQLVAEQKAQGIPKKRLLQVLVTDPEPLMYHGEIVYRNGKVVGDIRGASYGHSLGVRSSSIGRPPSPTHRHTHHANTHGVS